ncbi:MAG: hypothetical protein HY203_08920, partial [Nitrospirae bacterium]|nr:hypothetical protein [Nitrospirota bacterium]
MRNIPGRYGFILVALFAMVGGGAWPVQAESFSRISDIQGSLNLKGGDDENWTPATVNLYFNGYWAWYKRCGWTWVSSDPFGYVTFHYGAWIYDPVFGWCWVPGYTWRPAYVSWVAVGPYYAWAPLDPFGRVVVINRINVQVFTAAPKRIFMGDHPSARPIGGRFIPPGMRSNGSIQVADARMFQGAYPVVPIENFNTAQPVRLDEGSGLIGRTFTALKEHSDQAGIPRPAQPLTRGIEAFKRGHGPTTQGAIDRSRLPRTGRPEHPARNGGIQNATVVERPFFEREGFVRSESMFERGPGRVQSIHPSA